VRIAQNFYLEVQKMRKILDKRIQWVEPDNNRCKPYATLKSNGTLCFGQEMRKKLIGKVRLGFLAEECTLFVGLDIQQGFLLSQNGEVKVSKIAKQLRQLGMSLPVYFLFDEAGGDDCWKGHVVSPPRTPKSGAATPPTPATEQINLMSAYKWLIDKAVYAYAKSTPIDERRAIARTALFEAFCSYSPIDGSLTEHLSGQIKSQLIAQNKQYTHLRSLDTPSFDASINKNGLPWSRYKNEIAAAEDKIDMDFFGKQYLKPQEKDILKMLVSGYTESEIMCKHHLSQQALRNLCQSMGDRWTDFYQTSAAQ